MAFKSFEVDNIGTVNIYKRKGTRSMKLSITAAGEVRVSLPHWAPYQSGLEFVQSKREWITSIRKPSIVLRSHMRIGKAHSLVFLASDNETIQTRIAATEIRIYVPRSKQVTDIDVQKAAEKACLRSLKKEAERLLPQRLATLAGHFGFNYRQVAVKQLKSRWGSCNEKTDITLSLYLMQLPWELIDYVLLHELMHTKIMAHGPIFWSELSMFVSDLPTKRKAIKTHRPSLNPV
jgi:predicted metal-dependent hydrolase